MPPQVLWFLAQCGRGNRHEPCSKSELSVPGPTPHAAAISRSLMLYRPVVGRTSLRLQSWGVEPPFLLRPRGHVGIGAHEEAPEAVGSAGKADPG